MEASRKHKKNPVRDSRKIAPVNSKAMAQSELNKKLHPSTCGKPHSGRILVEYEEDGKFVYKPISRYYMAKKG